MSQLNSVRESDSPVAFSLFSQGQKTSTIKVSGTSFSVGCKIHLWFEKNPHLHEEHSVKVVVFLPLTVSDYSCLTTSQKELRSFLFSQKQIKITTSCKTLLADSDVTSIKQLHTNKIKFTKTTSIHLCTVPTLLITDMTAKAITYRTSWNCNRWHLQK